MLVAAGKHVADQPGTHGRPHGWVADYERHSDGFAACHYVPALGNGAIDPGIDAVRALHDRLSRAERALPLA